MSISRFHKLLVADDGMYVTQKRKFDKCIDLSEFVETSVQFAYDMTFGHKGAHRDYRTGGDKIRSLEEKYINTFQGKLAEYGLFEYIRNSSIACALEVLFMSPL